VRVLLTFQGGLALYQSNSTFFRRALLWCTCKGTCVRAHTHTLAHTRTQQARPHAIYTIVQPGKRTVTARYRPPAAALLQAHTGHTRAQADVCPMTLTL
jgi:hypothetical protein